MGGRKCKIQAASQANSEGPLFSGALYPLTDANFYVVALMLFFQHRPKEKKQNTVVTILGATSQ